MEEMKKFILGDVCSRLSSGKGISSEEVFESGPYPVIGGNGLRGYSLRSNFSGECGVIGRQGAYCGNVRFFSGEAYMTEHAVVVVGNEKADTRYLTYLLSTMHLGNLSAQSAQPGLSVKTLAKQEILLPSLPEQKRRASILASLEDKIDINNRINHNLEEQAQALYKSWFIDFEPFKDGKFVYSELGMIPEGWRVATLGEVTAEMRDKVGFRQNIKVLSPVTTGQLVLSEEFFTKQVFSGSIAKYLLVRPNDFAYNPARVNIGSLGKNEFGFDGCVSPVYVVFRCEDGYEHFFDLYRTTKPFKEEVISRSNGGVRQTLGYKDFALIKLVYPPISVIKEFNTIYINMLMGMKQCGRENMSLAKQRDELLPKLMMGDICFRNSTY